MVQPLVSAGADPDRVIESIKRYAGLAISWNRSVSNLISRNDERRIVERHLLESIEPAHVLKQTNARRWLDFGSGAGLPGIPLALAGIGEHWTLVESRRPKVLFMRKAIQELSIDSVEIVHSRLEAWLEESGGRDFDGFTSRATLTLAPTLKLAANLIVPGGAAFLWKGSGLAKEMEDDQEWRDQWSFDGVVRLESEHNVVARFTRIN